MMTTETETQSERPEPIAASITAACELWWGISTNTRMARMMNRGFEEWKQ